MRIRKGGKGSTCLERGQSVMYAFPRLQAPARGEEVYFARPGGGKEALVEGKKKKVMTCTVRKEKAVPCFTASAQKRGLSRKSP